MLEIEKSDTIKKPEPANVLGVRISALPVEEVIELIIQTILNREKAILAYANIHALNLAQELPWFRDFLNGAALTFCDGYGVKWGAKLLGLDIPYRYTPPDWFPSLAERCAGLGFTFFFLGARPGVAGRCAAILERQHPGLRIAGVHHGYFDKRPQSAENRAVLEQINRARPDILVVGFGMPAQERWLLENWERTEARVALPVGAMFDYLANEVQRAPRWMTDHGLEWLGRLFIEPRRLASRYLVGNPLFLWRVLKQRFGLMQTD